MPWSHLWVAIAVLALILGGCSRSNFRVGQVLYAKDGEVYGTVVEVGTHSFPTMPDVDALKVRLRDGTEVWQAENVTEVYEHKSAPSPAPPSDPQANHEADGRPSERWYPAGLRKSSLAAT